MLKKRHFMVDIETLGTIPGSAIISIGACEFTPGVGQFNDFYININLLDSLLEGFTIDPETLKWWLGQNKKAKESLITDVTSSVKYALTAFSTYLGPRNDDYYLWAKGPDFDLVLLDHAYKKLGWARAPWSYRNARDVRTALWIGDVIQPEAETEHDALSDAIAQARGVVLAMERIENGSR